MNNPPQEAIEQQPAGSFLFEPGSYGGGGHFMPSIACLKRSESDDWDYHFVLVNPGALHEDEDAASVKAARDLEVAFQKRERAGSDLAVAKYLRGQGYVSVNDFRVVQE